MEVQADIAAWHHWGLDGVRGHDSPTQIGLSRSVARSTEAGLSDVNKDWTPKVKAKDLIFKTISEVLMFKVKTKTKVNAKDLIFKTKTVTLIFKAETKAKNLDLTF